MTFSLALVLAMTAVTPPTPPTPPTPMGPDTSSTVYRDLYYHGVVFEAFLDAAEKRRETWHGNYRRGVVSAAMLARARRTGGPWHLLVIAEDWCGDSANTIPYLARLVEQVDGIDMRLINSTVGQGIMEAHPTPDGRPATPTVILLDADFNEVGAWVERPSTLQQWWLDNEDRLSHSERLDQKYEWYDRDAGEATIREIVALIEAAQ